jgi:hypothetical protein
MARWRRCSQVVDGGEVLVASGEGENTDELREVSANPSMSSRCSFASSRRRKRRLETGAALAQLRQGRAHRFPAQTTNLRASEETLVQGREYGTREGRRGSLARPESTGVLCRFAELRRAISRWPGDEF